MQFFKQGQKKSVQTLENICKACQGKIGKLALKIKFENVEDLKIFQQEYQRQTRQTIDLDQSSDQEENIKVIEKISKIQALETFQIGVHIAQSVILKQDFNKQIQDIANNCSSKILIIPSKIKIISQTQQDLENAVQQISEITKSIKTHPLKSSQRSQQVFNSKFYIKKLEPIKMIKVLNQYYLWYLEHQISKTVAQSKYDEIFQRIQHRFYQFSVDRAGNFELNRDNFYNVRQNIALIDCSINPTLNKYQSFIRMPKNRQNLTKKRFLLLKLKGKMFNQYFEKDINRLRQESRVVQLSLDQSALIMHCDAKEQFIMTQLDLEQKYRSYFYFLITVEQEDENMTALQPKLQSIIKNHECGDFICYGEKNNLWVALLQQKVQQYKEILCKTFMSLGLVTIGAFKNEVQLIAYENPKFTIQFQDQFLSNFTLKVRTQPNYQNFYDKVFIDILKQKKKIQQEESTTSNMSLSNVEYDSINVTHSIDQSTTFIDADESTLNVSACQQQAVLISMKKQKTLAGRLAHYNSYIPDNQGDNKYKQTLKLQKLSGKPQKQFEKSVMNLTKGNTYKAYNVIIPLQHKIQFKSSAQNQLLDRIVTVFIPQEEYQSIYTQKPVKAHLLQTNHKITKNGYLANCQINLLTEFENRQSIQLQPNSYEIIKYLKYLK